MKMHIYLLAAAQTFALTACGGPALTDHRVNTAASLPQDFNFTGHGLKVMSTLINHGAGTMSTLYGNSIAITAAKAGVHHAAGLEVIMITWQQQPNPYWYGNNIPGQLLTLEMVTVGKDTSQVNYALYEETELKANTRALHAQERASFILQQQPSIMP